MRNYILLIIGIFFILSTTSSFACDSADFKIEPNKLTVGGKVKVFAKADRAKVNFIIEGLGKTLKASFADAQVKIDSITSQLYAIGLTEKNISTSFFRNAENFGGKSFWSSKKDFKSNMTVTITTEKLELLKQVVIILSENKVKEILDVSFELINYEDLKLDALKRASAKARQKADIITEQLGAQYGNLLEFTEIQKDDPFIHVRGGRANPFNATFRMTDVISDNIDGIFPEEVELETEVKVVYELVRN